MAFEELKKKQGVIWGAAPYERLPKHHEPLIDHLVGRSPHVGTSGCSMWPRNGPTGPEALLEVLVAASDLEEVGAGADPDELAVVDDGNVFDALVEHHPQHVLGAVVGADGDDIGGGVVEEGLVVGQSSRRMSPRGDDPDEPVAVEDGVGTVAAGRCGGRERLNGGGHDVADPGAGEGATVSGRS